MVPDLLILAVDFHRAPLRFGHLTDPAQPLPEAFGTWLRQSSNALTPGKIQATANALGIRPKELRNAFLFLLRQTLLFPQADHYRALGLSRNSHQSAVKLHHSLLVRMFHPDRNPDQDERSIAITARINAAYRTLRDPTSRRSYDLSLPPLPRGVQSGTDRQVFFRPRDPITRFTRRTHVFSRGRTRTRAIILGVAVSAAAAGLLVLALREPQQPMLQINPQLSGKTTPGPSYLRQGSQDARHIGSGRSSDAEAAAPESVRAADESAPADGPRVVEAKSSDARAASDLVTRFQRSYANGDLPVLVSLFTADAIRDERAGLAFIRRAYSDIFARVGERRMSIFNLRWRSIPDERLLGTGDIRISSRFSSHSDWRHATGTIELELTRWMGDYKISKMVQHLSPDQEAANGW
jgi:hypothetical protein